MDEKVEPKTIIVLMLKTRFSSFGILNKGTTVEMPRDIGMKFTQEGFARAISY